MPWSWRRRGNCVTGAYPRDGGSPISNIIMEEAEEKEDDVSRR
jgi:hypothetical protein